MHKTFFGTFAGCALMALAVVACAQQAAPPAAGDVVVARIGDEVITAAEMESMVGPSLVQLRQQIYDTSVAELNQQIFERLVVAKATAAGITRDEYLKQNVDAKMTPPDEGEIVKIMSMYRNRLAADDAQAREQVVQALQQQQKAQLLDALRKEMFEESGVVILLEPPRVEVAVAEGTPSRGPASAPIVLVEYTDYQCPYCARAQPTIAAVMERYDGQIRHVFKNLPLPMHAQAQLAAEAALCAQDQGLFWEFHDWLFDNQRTMNRDSMITQAGAMNMDVDLFTACIDRGTYQEKVDADMREARGFGITGTPGFMINGRVLTGAQPPEAFEAIIDEELTRKGIAIPPKPEPAQAAEAAETTEEPVTE
jgi:protein-disulfide isomerase